MQVSHALIDRWVAHRGGLARLAVVGGVLAGGGLVFGIAGATF